MKPPYSFIECHRVPLRTRLARRARAIVLASIDFVLAPRFPL